MPLSEFFNCVLEKEKAFLGMLGVNVSLGGVRVAAEKAHSTLTPVMPFLSDFLIVAQVALAVASFIYVIIKIRRATKGKNED